MDAVSVLLIGQYRVHPGPGPAFGLIASLGGWPEDHSGSCPPCETAAIEGGWNSSSLALKLQPNPTSGFAAVQYSLVEPSERVHLAVFNVKGELVATLRSGPQEAGSHAVAWDGESGGRVPVPEGVYFVRLTSGDESTTQKVVIAR